MMGVFIVVVCGQWAGQAVGDVNVDVGGVRVHVGEGQPPPPEEIVVLTRGPLHEAFAQPVILDEGEAFMIANRPPAPLDEMVPDEKPEGNHIVWIPGYWSWDTDRNDFIWVSGCWRAVPPNRSWVPGYWAQVRGGYQWIAGFWTTADAEEIEYLPTPPATLEEGPPPGEGSPSGIWIPGCWVRHDGRYAWRPGFWEPARPHWVWQPAYYVATPRGWVYVEGYWDYSLDRRGVAFLPIYAPSRLYGRSDFRYSPDMVLDLNTLMLNLFISPRRHHYYYGDYYGAEYSREGYRPWYEVRDHHDWYDPIYVHQRWEHRDDHQWGEHQREGYDRRRDNKDLRPARTYEAMRTQSAHLPEKDRREVQLARPMREVVSEKTTPFKYEKLDTKRRDEAVSREKEVHAYKDKRAQWESTSAVSKDGREPRERTVQRDVVTSKEPDRTSPRESQKQPVKDVTPDDKSRTLNRGDVAGDQSAARDAQPQKVKIPKSPTVVRESVRDKDLTAPPKPKEPKADPEARQKNAKDATDRSKDNERSAKDKSDKDNTDKDNSDKDKSDKDKSESKK
jgi:hypothetical protein